MSEENKFIKLFSACGIPRLTAVFFWFAGIDIIVLRNNGISAVPNWQDFINGVPVFALILRTVIAFALLTLIRFLIRKNDDPELSDSIALFTGSVFFACCALYKNESFYLTLGVLLLCIVFAVYAAGRSDLSVFDKLSFKTAAVITAVIAAAVTVFICIISVCRHMTYDTACFDMGIFAQMYHSMKTEFTMNTTCERDYLLSHFSVHPSVILYVLLPFYALFPSVKTLVIAQALLCISGVIPVVLIAKKRGFKGAFIVLLSIVYIFNAGIISPSFFHFHENCFLPAILMWLLYAVDTRKTVLIYILSALTCTVKEDAPLYIICIGLFLLADEKGKKRFHGLIIAVAALICFVIMMSLLISNGSGDMMMEQRFSNLVFGDNNGFGGIVLNILRNPSYFFSLFFSEKSLTFFLQMMLPLLFLPFFTTKIRRYFLMLPFVIMNLVIGSGYRYAAEMGFHYAFGTSCLLIFMTILNCSDLKEESRRTVTAAIAAAALITAMPVLSCNMVHLENYSRNASHFQNIEACLASIPQDACVIADTNYLPHVAERKELYLLDESDLNIANGKVLSIKDIDRYDYFVMNAKDGNMSGTVAILESSGFTRFAESECCVIIYKKN